MADEKIKAILKELGIENIIDDFKSKYTDLLNCYVSYLHRTIF